MTAMFENIQSLRYNLDKMWIFAKFLDTCDYYSKGKGSPWRLILVWFVLYNIISFFVGAFVLIVLTSIFFGKDWQWAIVFQSWLANYPWFLITIKLILIWLYFLVGIFGLIIAFIYPFVFIYSLWQCANNIKWKWGKIASRLLILPYLIIQYYLSFFYLIGSMLALQLAFGNLQKILV